MGKLQKAVAEAAQQPDVRTTVEAAGNGAISGTSEQFKARFMADVQRFKNIVKDARIPFQD